MVNLILAQTMDRFTRERIEEWYDEFDKAKKRKKEQGMRVLVFDSNIEEWYLREREKILKNSQ